MKTRKLKSLGLHEAIKVNTLAQAKYFIEKLGWENDLSPKQLVGNYICLEDEGHFSWVDFLPCANEIPASDFIKPKKSKFRKLEKRVEQIHEALIRHNERLTELETGKVCEGFEDVAKTELQFGKWYKTDHAIVCYQGLPDIEQPYPSFKGYGMIEGDWIGKESEEDSYNGWTISADWIEATPEEVESALIKEAERRGFKKGVLVKSLLYKRAHEFNGMKIKLSTEKGDPFALRGGGMCLYHNGKWAEILPNEEETIDWSKAGQLVESDRCIIYTDGKHDDRCFSGIVVKLLPDNIVIELGDNNNLWSKEYFKPFKGELTLKNE